jgi:hypothetical protein
MEKGLLEIIERENVNLKQGVIEVDFSKIDKPGEFSDNFREELTSLGYEISDYFCEGSHVHYHIRRVI